MADGRLDGRAVPLIGHPSPAVTTSDARGGIAQTGFDGAFPGLVQAAQEYGLAAFAQQGSFTCGPLGWFTERLADAGLVAVATAVSPAVLAAGPGTGRVFGTNPMAWSVPRRTVRRSPSTRPRAAPPSSRCATPQRRAHRCPRGGPSTRTAARRPIPRPPWTARCSPSAGTRARTSPCSSSSCPRWRAATGRWTRPRGTRVRDPRRSGCSSSPSITAPSGPGSPRAPPSISTVWPTQGCSCRPAPPRRPTTWSADRRRRRPPAPRAGQ